ncbi:ABC transporter substrate-binding protein [Paenibacillus guangzhouensis]|uniref:ABC transporter substrate-binding protein n=1 Tax=Paenibacillus guangzhouensis TaxID=1473112 RepID=UPI0012674C63|nr:ABC transporter substrate-binding protein [Paenibacillus guangzhouensis]
MKKIAVASLSLAVLTLLTVGCSTTNKDTPTSSNPSVSAQSSTKPSDSGTGRPAEFKKIKMVALGDESPRMKDFMTDVNKKLKDELNTELTVQYMPWSAYGSGQQIELMLAAGQDFDFTFTDPTWLNQLVQKKEAYDLTELADKYMPDLKKNLTPQHFEEFTINNKLYGIPMGYAPLSANAYSISIRQDLLEEVNMSEIKSMDDLYTFATLVKAKHPDMYATPNTVSFVQPYLRGLSDKNYTWDQGLKYFLTDENASEGKLVSFIDSPEFKTQSDFFNKLYTNGLLAKDILTNKAAAQDLFASGKYMWMQGRSGGNNIVEVLPNLQKNVPNAKLKDFLFAPDKPKIKNAYSSTAVMVPAYSKNAERVAMVLNLMQKNLDNFDFFAYGIKDKDYKLVNDKVERINKDELFYQWALFNVNFPRYETTVPDSFITINKTWDNGAIPSKAFGFTPNMEPVKVERAKLDSVYDERIKPILVGVISYDKGIEVAKKEMAAAGWDKYYSELQKQFSAYRAGKK